MSGWVIPKPSFPCNCVSVHCSGKISVVFFFASVNYRHFELQQGEQHPRLQAITASCEGVGCGLGMSYPSFVWSQ